MIYYLCERKSLFLHNKLNYIRDDGIVLYTKLQEL